jgi:hypothetical protein
MEREETRTITQVVGANMRRIRESRAKVLHDVATAARDLGLTWDPSAVSRIETGKRDMTLEEFLALPLVMTLALNEIVTLADLLEADVEDELLLSSFGRFTSLYYVRPMLAEPFLKWIGREKQAAERVRDWLNDQKRRAQVAREPDEERTVAREMQSVADEFGVSLSSVVEAYNELWDAVSLGGERERRLLKSGAALSSPTSARTVRGHLTRQLMAELRDYFASQSHELELDRG